jgi:hypothetical protein
MTKNDQRQLAMLDTSPEMKKPIPAPTSSPDRIIPNTAARSRAGKKSPDSEAMHGHAAATTAPSPRRVSSRKR